MGRFTRALAHVFNAFTIEEEQQTRTNYANYGASYGSLSRPHSVRVQISNERSIIAAIYSRLAVDVASASLKHVRVDTDTGLYKEDINSGLNECLTVEANIDQGPRAFLQDYALTLFDKGVAAIVPVDTTIDPRISGSWDVNSMRVGTITAWYPRMVKVRLYNDRNDKGIFEEILLPKSQVAIVENPFYSTMNESNSTLQRLIRKLNLLDTVDEASSSGKLDLIIQLPYAVKSEARRKTAAQRMTDIEFQLKDSKYGIAYADATEKITQLNRPVTNNLMDQIKYLRDVVLDQLGVTAGILNGSASETEMLNYNARTIKPILDALQEEYIRKFLTKTARTQGQTIMYFRNPFELMPLSQLAEVADVLSRNEIVAPNELRTSIGMKPHPDPAANQLANSNMPAGSTPGNRSVPTESAGNSNPLDDLDKAIDEAFAGLNLNGAPNGAE